MRTVVAINGCMHTYALYGGLCRFVDHPRVICVILSCVCGPLLAASPQWYACETLSPADIVFQCMSVFWHLSRFFSVLMSDFANGYLLGLSSSSFYHQENLCELVHLYAINGHMTQDARLRDLSKRNPMSAAIKLDVALCRPKHLKNPNFNRSRIGSWCMGVNAWQDANEVQYLWQDWLWNQG